MFLHIQRDDMETSRTYVVGILYSSKIKHKLHWQYNVDQWRKNVTCLTDLVQLDLCSGWVWADLEQGLIVQAGSDWDWDIASWTDPALQSCQIQGSWFSVFWDTEQNRGGLRQPAHSYNCSRIISARINKSRYNGLKILLNSYKVCACMLSG